MFNKNLKPQTLISSLWIFVLFNMILRDLHEFPTEGYIEEMMGLHLSEESMLFFAFIVEIPILMVILPRLLNNKANKWMNVIAVFLSSLGILYTLPGGHLDEYFFAAMNLGAFFLIIRTAWRLPVLKQAEIPMLQNN